MTTIGQLADKDVAIAVKTYKYDRLYMDIATRCAAMSYGERAKVGCVIVRDGNILSMGWNGMPRGWDNTCEDNLYDDTAQWVGNKTKPEVSHAEENAIAKLAKSTTTSAGATAYVTLEPCLNCSKLLYSSGITRVVIDKPYREHYGVQFLLRCNIPVVWL